MNLTYEDTRFLAALHQDGAPTHSWRLPVASREQDRARTRAKKNGLAIFDRASWAWHITDLGRTALSQNSGAK